MRLGLYVRPALSRALLCLASMALSGCGYHFAAGGAPLAGQVRLVRAPIFENRAAEPGAELLFTDAFREQLDRAGRLGGELAEATAQGELLSVSSGGAIAGMDPATGKFALQTYSVAAAARVRLVRDEKVLAEANVSGAESYLPGSDLLVAEANRRLALRRLAGRLMRDAYDQLCRP